MLCHRALLALTSVIATGCALSPERVQPAIDAPVAWKEAPPATGGVESQPLPFAWWQIFGEPELDALEAQVIAANHDLQRAISRVAEARALARVAAADLTPALSAGAQTTRQRTSANQRTAIGADREITEHRLGFDLGFEIDFWGRNRQATNAARADALAEESDFHVVWLALTAETARHYHELRALDAETQVIEATRALRRETLGLQATRHQAGLINEADVMRARTELANVEAELHALARHRARLEHALAVLVGETPGTFSLPVRPHSSPPPAIPVGLPSDLLQRRPDIAAAEQHLKAARARIAVARADFFPRISLTSSAGFASTDLSNLTRGASGTWSFGPSLYLPLFDSGRNRANLGAAEARYEQSAAAFRGVVLNAFREVEDALSELNSLSRQTEAVRQAMASARDTAALAHERYQRGLSSYLDVVDAQRGVFQAERHDAQLRGQQAVSTILLAKALGGGWQRDVSPTLP